MAMRYCNVCGAQLLEGARFCSKCRNPVQQVETSGQCRGCGAPLIQGAAFCSKCRMPVGEAAPAQTQQPNNAAIPKRAAQTAKKIIEHSMNASNAPCEMRVSLNQASGEQLFNLLGSILKGGGL